jgi:hypothetical protein
MNRQIGLQQQQQQRRRRHRNVPGRVLTANSTYRLPRATVIILICISRVWVGQSGSRYRPAMSRTRSAASAAGHSGRGDEQRACRGSVQDRHGAGRGAERGFGHPDHRDAELGVRACAQAGPAAGVQVGVVVGHQQAQPVQIGQDRTRRRKLTQVELARSVGRYPGTSAVPSASTCAKAAWAARRLPPGRRRCSGSARPRRRTPRSGRPPVSMS